MDDLERFASEISRSGEVQPTSNGFDVNCPGPNHKNGDQSPSLSIARVGDKFLMHCKSGCHTKDILAAANKTEADLFIDDASASPPPAKKKLKEHDTAQAALKAAHWSVSEKYKKIEKSKSYEYKNADGSIFGYVARFDVPGDKVFKQIKHLANGKWQCTAGDDPWPLYRLTEMPTDGPVFLHEGEKAACAGAAAGLPSIASKGGCKAASQSDWTPLCGKEVVILPDNDQQGEKYAAEVTKILHQLVPPATVKIVRLDGRPSDGGDFADILAACADCKDEEVLAGLRQTVESIAADTEAEIFVSLAVKSAPENQAKNIFEKPKRIMVTQCMADIQPRAVDWLWKNRIPMGQLTLLTGPQGGTKSFLTVDLATRVSQGSKHPDGTGVCPQGQALFFTTEDEPGQAIVPRLQACGANMKNVHYMYGTAEDLEDDTENAKQLKLKTDIELLEQTISGMGNVKLLIFDPLEDYIDGDNNNNKEVRTALTQLKAMAQRQNIAVVAVHHINKRSNDVTAVQTAGGAGAWTQVPRSVLHVIADPEDDNLGATRRRLVIVTKSNYGGTNEAQAYRLSDAPHPSIEWLPNILTVDANAVVKASTQSDDGRKKTDKREMAIADLHEIMQDGPLDTKDIEQKMRDRGHSERQIRVARKENGLEKVDRPKNTDPHRWKLPQKLAIEDSTLQDFYDFADGP